MRRLPVRPQRAFPLLLLWLVRVAPAAVAGPTPYVRGVPYLSQRENAIDPSGSCQNTAMAMVLRYYGATALTPDMISRRWGTARAQTVGGWESVFNTLAEEYDLPVRDHGVSDGWVSGLRRTLMEGSPAVVHGGFTSSGHLLVLLGCDEDYYYAHDPYGDWSTYYSERSGRHVRYPREEVERVIGDWVRYHHFEPAAPGPSLSWDTPPPDSLIAGEAVGVFLAVRLDSAGGDAEVTADLSAIGGPAAQAMTRAATGEYRLARGVSAAPERPGLWPISARAVREGEVAQIAATVAVLAARDMPVYADDWTSSWQLEWSHGAELNPTATRFVYEGAAALQVQAAGFNVRLRPRDPLGPHGYSHLRFALLPDSVAGADPRLSVYVNGDTRTIAPVVGPNGDGVIDLGRREWQVVEIPMTAFSWLEEPIESLHLMGRLGGSIYLDDIRWVAARPCPIAASWISAPPDTLVAGRPAQIAAELRVASRITASPPEVSADLSAFGGRRVPLRRTAPGQYQLAAGVGVDSANGFRDITFRIQQEDQGQAYVRELVQRVCVIPAGDQLIFGDALRWQPVFVGQAELEVVESSESLEGTSLLVVEAGYFTIDLRAPVPVETTGYEYLRFAFLAGAATATASPMALNVSVNGDSRTTVRLLGGTVAGFGLDPESPGWQEVAIPLAAFGGFEGDLRTVRFLGNLRGTFYLDDVRLVAARAPWPATAIVARDRVAEPRNAVLRQNYPNPFNVATVISYELAEPAPVELTVYNSAGQAVRRLVRGPRSAGLHRACWDGRDGAGEAAASGLYIVGLRSGCVRQARKLLLLR